MLQAARCKCRTQKSRQKSPSGHHPTTLSGYIFATKACIDKWKKNLSSNNISSTCPHNMVNFGQLAAEIVSLVWGTPGNFSGFRVLAALLRGTLVVGVSQTVALNRGRHLYSAGRPSRWAFAHISSCFCITRISLNIVKTRCAFNKPIRAAGVFPCSYQDWDIASGLHGELHSQLPYFGAQISFQIILSDTQ